MVGCGLSVSLSLLVQCDHRQRLADLSSSKSALNLSDGSSEHIGAALLDNVGALLAAIELDKLTSGVDNEGCEVMLDFRLLLSLIALTFCRETCMHGLEISVCLK